MDILLDALPQIANGSVQLAILGTGKAKYEAALKAANKVRAGWPPPARVAGSTAVSLPPRQNGKHPLLPPPSLPATSTPPPPPPAFQRPGVAGVVKFSAPLAHLITAGADFLFVPSRFEPCAWPQRRALPGWGEGGGCVWEQAACVATAGCRGRQRGAQSPHASLFTFLTRHGPLPSRALPCCAGGLIQLHAMHVSGGARAEQGLIMTPAPPMQHTAGERWPAQRISCS